MSVSSRLRRVEGKVAEKLKDCPKCFGMGPFDWVIVFDGDDPPTDKPPCPLCGWPAQKLIICFAGVRFIPESAKSEIGRQGLII
jgi:hypothetical protein